MHHHPFRIAAIAAMDEDRVIGKDNSLPWRIPGDMKRFAALTTGHSVLMGRKTYQSLPDKFRPLPGRTNIVITRDPAALRGEKGIEVALSPEGFIESVKNGDIILQSDKLWIIGGEQIYRATLPFWDEVCLTLVKGRHPGDAFFPEFESSFRVAEQEDCGDHLFFRYIRN